MHVGGEGPTMHEDADLVNAARSGEPSAYSQLVERWLDRCWDVAWRILRDRDLAADVAQEAMLAGWQHLDRLEQPAAFGGWTLRIARNRALDVLARERRTMSTDDEHILESRSTHPGIAEPEVETDRDERQRLVWAAAAALGERDTSLLDLHLRHGLGPAELADELGVAPNAAHQALFRLRQRLGDAIRAWVLWRGGEPTCIVLRAEIVTLGATRFDAQIVRAVRAHVGDCTACAEERDRATAPAALFSAVPLVAMPAAARAEVLAALARAGVPVAGGNTGESAGSRRDRDGSEPADLDGRSVASGDGMPSPPAAVGGSAAAPATAGGNATVPAAPAGSAAVPAAAAGSAATHALRRGLVSAAVVLVATVLAGGLAWLEPEGAGPAGTIASDEPDTPLATPPTTPADPAPPAELPATSEDDASTSGAPDPALADRVLPDDLDADGPSPTADKDTSDGNAQDQTSEPAGSSGDESPVGDEDSSEDDELAPPTFAAATARRGPSCGPSFGDPRYTYQVAWEAPGAEAVLLDAGDGHEEVGTGATGAAEVCDVPGGSVGLRATNSAGSAEVDVTLD
jgi:RNA polymerase sigma factor (sigma-70 family)